MGKQGTTEKAKEASGAAMGADAPVVQHARLLAFIKGIASRSCMRPGLTCEATLAAWTARPKGKQPTKCLRCAARAILAMSDDAAPSTDQGGQ